MKTFNLAILITLTIINISCRKEHSIGTSKLAAASYTNVAYGSDPLQNMDVFLPEGRAVTTTKVIVLIHGGAWSSGDKTDMVQVVDSFKKRFPDYAIFNINYRLSANPANLFPTQENDTRAAMEFIYSKKTEYLISDKWALIGVSAGGHLAMLQGYKYNSPVIPKAIVSLSGPSDLTDMYQNPAGGSPLISALLISIVGKSPAQDPQLYFNSSPVNFITATSPPTLLLYGDVDPLVTPQQAMFVKDKLQAAGVANQNVLYVGSAHVDTWSNAVFNDAFQKIDIFLNAHVL
ncbi:MAG: alpha/beta hydrolase [Ferruginibacter sp.]